MRYCAAPLCSERRADGSFSIRSDQEEADRLLGTTVTNRHIMKGNFVWDLPDIRSDHQALKAIGLVANDWRFAGVWSARTGVESLPAPATAAS